ncbi:MAG: Asp-tRNA(Asn)/Glu-tRNA(Gln) amidotransferase subunit GatC [Patescibacteria group bacterium]
MPKTPAIDVEYLAQLARLKLTDQEKKRFSQQLADVLSHVAKLGELDLDKVEPTFQTTGLTDAVREDEVQSERVLGPEEALANAPRRRGKFFEIPKVL